MKKVLSLVLVLVMVLAVVPFAAFSIDASAVESDYSENLALGKSYTISVTNKGVTSAYHPINCNANLTDGITTGDVSANAIANNKWLAVQTYSNCIPVSSNGYGYIAEIVVDLGKTYNVTEARIHFTNCDSLLSDGYVLRSFIGSINVYGGPFSGSEQYSIGYSNVSYKNGVIWESYKAGSIKSVRYVKFAITLEHVSEAVVYGLIDEIQVFGAYNNEVKYTEYAKNATYKIYNSDGTTVKTARGYSGKLNDGISDVPVITDRKNPLTGKYNYNNGNWFGLFDNPDTSEQNCPDGKAYIWIDLGSVKEINKIRLFYAYDYHAGISNTYVSNDNVNFTEYWYSYDICEYGTYGEWWGSDFTFEARYVVLEIRVLGYWGLFNEIQLLGHSTTNVSAGKSYTINGVSKDEFKYARGYTGDLTDGIADEALVSWLPNPVTGVENYSNGKYLGLFKNPDAPDESNVTGYRSEIILDLEQLCELSLVKIFFANGYDGGYKVYFSIDGVTYSQGEYLYPIEYGTYGAWDMASCETVARYVKIEITHYTMVWTLMSEIVVKGNPIA